MSWSFKKINEIGNVVTGKTPSTKIANFWNGEYMFVTPSDLDYRQYYCRDTERYVSEEARDRMRNQFIPVNSVMFTSIGNTIGKCAISAGDCLTNQQINSIIANEQNDFKFIYYLLCNNVERFKNLGGGSATPIVNKTTFEHIKFKVPNKSMQRRISSILSAYDDLIENNLRRIKLLEESARLLYKEWFVRLRFPGYEHTRIIDGVPEGWERCKVKDFGRVITGKTPSTKQKDNYGGDLPLIKTPDMHGNVYVIQTETLLTEKGAETQKGKYLPPESILVSCIGTIGIVSLNSEISQFNQQINAVIPYDDSYRYYCYFCFKDLKPRLEAIGGGATMNNVNKSKFENIDVLKPKTMLLKNFNDFCTPLFRQILRLSFTNHKLQQARDILLPKLMSGEVEV